MKKQILLFFCFIALGSAYSQTILTVNGEDVSKDEFVYMFKKSNPDVDFTKDNVNEYFDLFTNYKLKLAEAKAQGIDQDPEVLREIALYEDKLIQSELDKEMMNELLQQAKTRLQEEICASHLLVDLRSNPEPIDTALAYKKAMKLRDRILAGEDFGYLVEKNSADIETKFSDGNLGCFTTLQLSSYDLENKIYSLRKGELSMPFRSRDGYHIIKINDRRPTNGMVKATQLFARSNNTQSDEQNELARKAINEAYAQLRNGEDLTDAYQTLLDYKDDIAVSRDNIDWFTVGTYEADFENGIFSLKEEGDFSKPIKTSLGWHIFKLDERKPLPEFEKIEGAMRDKIMEDERYFKSKIKFADRIKRKYDFEKNQENVDLFVKQVASGISIEGWIIPTIYDLNSEFFTIGKKVYTARQFVNYVKEQHHLENYRTFYYYYNSFESNNLLNYHKQNLVAKDKELSNLMKEYHNGIVLFNLMEKELWNTEPSENELKEFYDEHRSEYRESNEVVARQYTVDKSKSSTINKLKRLLDRGKGEYAIKRLNRRANVVDISERILLENEALIDGVDLTEIGNYATINEGDKLVFLRSEKINAGQPLDFKDAKSEVLSNVQHLKEMEWIDKMKEKHQFTVNKAVLESLYK